jgi:hypothetical protein
MVEIDYNFEAEKQFKDQLALKNQLISRAIEYSEKFVKIKDIKAFQQNITKEFTRLFIDKYRNEFPSIVSNDKMFLLAEVDLNKLAKIEAEFNDIKIDGYDFATSSYTEIDFSIKTTNENQKNEFIKLDKFVKVINENIDLFRQGIFYRNNFSQIINGSIVYDSVKNQFKVNTHYIQFIR